MKHYCINIKNSGEKFIYPIQITERNFSFDNHVYYAKTDDVYMFTNDHPLTVRRVNNFEDVALSGIEIPTAKAWSLSVLFPEYRDFKITQYFIDAYLYINSTRVHVLSQRLSVHDILATERTMTYDNIRYYECINLTLPSPYDIIYSDGWKVFREEVCGETPNTNTVESLLTIELTPINGDCVVQDYVGGYTSVSITGRDNSMENVLVFDEDFNIKNMINFNAVYDGDFQLYMKETYGIENIYSENKIVGEVVLKDNNNIYRFLEREIKGENDLNISYNKKDLEMTWSDWKVGMTFISTLNIYDREENEVMVLYSDPLPVTLETFAYLISKEEKIDLDTINMKIYNLDVVNKIEKRIVTVTNNANDKSNIINNVFIHSSKIDDLNIYPKVCQNIVIPLNGYKNKVSTFYLLIEDVIFMEIGRNPQGVIFKIDGNLLPNKTQSGVYHVLNDVKELVTVGNYKYIQ